MPILHLPNISISNPFKVKNGWIGEEDDGMKLWPPISIVDIIDYFREQRVNSDKLLSFPAKMMEQTIVTS